jgi:hypothetical protein
MNHNVESYHASVKLLLVGTLVCNVNIPNYDIVHYD